MSIITSSDLTDFCRTIFAKKSFADKNGRQEIAAYLLGVLPDVKIEPDDTKKFIVSARLPRDTQIFDEYTVATKSL
uniref:Uncharacterized protein n=1 Tax=Acrobeloides nanus TaxID=290746 RepID=A0A914CLP9_9BILA